MPPQIELGSRLAAGAWRGAPTPSRPSAERGGLDGVRRRLPATSTSMVICAAGLSPARSAALQALRLPPPHPSPSCAAGSLASVRGPRTARTPQARRPLGSSGTGQRCCSRSHGVLTRHTHTARSYTAYAQLNASRRRRAHTFSSLEAQARSDEIMALPSVPQQEGRWATARASTARSEVNYFPSVSARQAGRIRRARSVCCPRLAPAPPRTQHRSPDGGSPRQHPAVGVRGSIPRVGPRGTGVRPCCCGVSASR